MKDIIEIVTDTRALVALALTALGIWLLRLNDPAASLVLFAMTLAVVLAVSALAKRMMRKPLPPSPSAGPKRRRKGR